MSNAAHKSLWRSAPVLWTAIFLAVCALIIVPFVLGGEAVDEWTTSFLEQSEQRPALTAAVLFGLLALDVVLPTPSSIISTALGARFGIVGGSIIGFIAMTISCAIGYWLGCGARLGTRSGVIPEGELSRLERLSARFGDWVLVILRPVPVLAEASTIFAGLGAVPLTRFFLITGAANLGISIGYACVGALAVDASSFLIAFVGALLVPGVLMGIFHLVRMNNST